MTVSTHWLFVVKQRAVREQIITDGSREGQDREWSAFALLGVAFLSVTFLYQ